MGKLIATTQATLDGVIDPVGEWVQPDGDHGDYSFERQARSGGLVLGRKTFEGLAGYWPSQTGKWADMVNAMPKYVGSNTLSGDLEWNATLLEGDLEDSIPKLKDEVDGDLFMHGSGEFAYALAEKGLIDEYEIYLNPLVRGQGNVHVLGDRGTVRMELDDVKRFDPGWSSSPTSAVLTSAPWGRSNSIRSHRWRWSSSGARSSTAWKPAFRQPRMARTFQT